MSRLPVLLLALVATFALIAPTSVLRAEEAPGQIIGTYDPQAVAQAVGFQEKVMAEMQGLQGRAEQAQQQGDQAAMQQIQAEAQKIQQDATSEFLAAIEAALPIVAEATEAKVLGADISYVAPGFEIRDVTEDLVAAMSPAAE